MLNLLGIWEDIHTYMLSENEIIFLGGIDSNKWINDGKNLSRNFKQGYRVYNSEGIATTLTSQSVGGLGGYSGLYLVEEQNE